MKTTSRNSSWVPPSAEWDFRAINAEECSIACYWEYSRTLSTFSQDPESWINHKHGFGTFFMFSAGERNPHPWTRLDAKERRAIRDCIHKPEAFMIKPLKELIAESLRRMNGNHRKAVELMSGYPAHVVWTDFARHGSEKVIEGFRTWARRAFQQCPQTLRGKAAAPPFGPLKWLAAYRLECSRRNARVTLQSTQTIIGEFQRQGPGANRNDVLPLYASAGAWSKAVTDAKRMLKIHESDPMALCVKLLDPVSWDEYRKCREKRSR